MNSLRKCIAGITALGMIAGATLPANAIGPNRGLGASTTQGLARFQVAGVPHSMFPSRDFGRRAPLALVTATVMLRYNNQSQLDALLSAQSDRRSPLYHHFVTSDQFNSYFAPTLQQQAFVAATLQAAGLRVTHAYPNRTLLDVQGTSAAAERFFGTEIHSISQAASGCVLRT